MEIYSTDQMRQMLANFRPITVPPNATPAEVSPEPPVQLGALGVGTSSGHEPLSPELEECRKAHEIAALACAERQPMPTEGIAPRLIAEACEYLGEVYAKDRLWRACADAHRMACWYYGKALAE